MLKLSPEEKIQIFKDLFRGREEIFAVRWEKADKSASGYTPVCLNEWKAGLCLKLERGKCRDCQNKKYPSLNEYYIEQHLRGYKAYGIYPLFDDNSSHFLAADFDGEKWKNDCLEFIKKCAEYNLHAYLERSRSGRGGHVWLFFAAKYPAFKSRKIAFTILQQAHIIDEFEKQDSFDRLFPNQDILSGVGIGNLIALPLQGKVRKENNSIFLNLQNNLQPYEDQWNFLREIKRIDTEKLDQLYSEFIKEKRVFQTNKSGVLSIKLGEQIQISKSNLPKSLTTYLRDSLNFLNIDYIVKKKIGLSVYGVEKYFKFIESNKDHVSIPRGFFDDLTHYLDDNKIKFTVKDNRIQVADIDYTSSIKLHDYQKIAVEKLLSEENGILVAPPGSGKTVIGIELISRRRQPTLILVHKKQIFNQWIERIENFLNIPKREIGQFASGKKKVGTSVTVAMVQTLNRLDDVQKLNGKFGMIIVDECHHIPAKMFRNVITKFKPYYLYGLTATPERKYNDEKLIYIHLGQIIHTIESGFNKKESTNRLSGWNKEIKIIFKETKLFVPFKIKTDDFQILSKIITFDSQRNQQIVDDLESCVEKKLKCLVLSERKEHLQVLNYYIKREYDTIVLTGDLTESQRKMKIKQIKSNNFQILLATGQLVGEGTDFDNLDCLFLVYPFAFSGKLTQYIGRIQRGNTRNKYIYDYRDNKVEFLENLFKKRLRYYKKYFNM